ncbi:MAG: metallophosphoesterase [Candidatus Heimdallarchaeota archaeon]|nr:metallophosphoesterase [Candidatus Heimdallarchaeota archaeon]MCK4612613.1 metallophosphoesterase [Candidatus Heimdallarchaeota archaeon]
MKSKSFIFGITILFLTVSLILPHQNILSKQEKPEDYYPSFDYFANSPTEFFNETQNPRYALVARLFGMIQYPNKANPSIIVFNEKLNIITSGSSSASDWNFTLHKTNSSQILNIISSDYVDDKWCFETLPSLMEEGLYDLQLNCSEGSDYQTHAVKIIEEKTYPFTFVHISDTHFPSYYKNDIDFNTSDINLEELAKIKALNPDFVIFTGDLIQGPTLYFLNPVTGKHMRGEIQLRLGLWALDTLDLPVYCIHGNHEFSQSTMLPDIIEDNWYNYLGPIRYQNFTYLDWTMVGYGSSFEGLNSEEILQMRQILSENSDDATILYYHHDFHSDATNFNKRYPIEVNLYGHEHIESLYLSNDVLYHIQEPLFDRGFTQFTILNETSLSVDSTTYNFELLPYITPTPSSYAFLFAFLSVLTLAVRKKKRIKK